MIFSSVHGKNCKQKLIVRCTRNKHIIMINLKSRETDKYELWRRKRYMKRYIALLRGINVSGKNKISMSELKKGFAELGFEEVTTYLNSGNVIFSSAADDINILSNKIESMIKVNFDLDIPVFIVLQEDLKELLNNAPDWWSKTASSNISDKITI